MTRKPRKNKLQGHPCDGCTPGQVATFEAIAVNQYRGHGSKVPPAISALLARGLIERLPDRIMGTGPFAVRVPDYAVPLPLHAQWCKWCADNVTETEVE